MNFHPEHDDKVSPNREEIYGRDSQRDVKPQARLTVCSRQSNCTFPPTGCNLLVMGVFVLAYWTGSDSPHYTPSHPHPIPWDAHIDIYYLLVVS